jgi:hypothetical protein
MGHGKKTKESKQTPEADKEVSTQQSGETSTMPASGVASNVDVSLPSFSGNANAGKTLSSDSANDSMLAMIEKLSNKVDSLAKARSSSNSKAAGVKRKAHELFWL